MFKAPFDSFLIFSVAVKKKKANFLCHTLPAPQIMN